MVLASRSFPMGPPQHPGVVVACGTLNGNDRECAVCACCQTFPSLDIFLSFVTALTDALWYTQLPPLQRFLQPCLFSQFVA